MAWVQPIYDPFINGVFDASGAVEFKLTQGASLPSSSNPGDLFYNTATGVYYGCAAANTWTPLAVGPVVSAVNSGLVTGGTITTSGVTIARVSPAAAVTGAIMQAGTVAGQSVKVINESANTITMAASGTSNTADGTSDIIPALAAREFCWDAGTSLWYRLG